MIPNRRLSRSFSKKEGKLWLERYRLAADAPASKYHVAKKADRQLDGYTFDSKRELQWYGRLLWLQQAGEIENLTVHPKYDIVWPGTRKKICTVELDFSYTDLRRDKLFHVVDVKGVDTPMSRLKRKLVEQAFKMKVELVK